MNDFSKIDLRDVATLATVQLVKETPILSAIYRDTDLESIGRKGSTIDVILPPNLGSADDHGDESVATGIEADVAEIKLDKHKYKEVKVSDRELSTSMAAGLLPATMQQQISVIAEAVTSDVLAGYGEIYNYSIGGDSTFGNAAFVKARTLMNKQGIAKNGRQMILNSGHAGDFLQAVGNKAAVDTVVNREGEIGKWMGFNTAEEVALDLHEAGDAAGYTVSAVAENVVTIAGGTGAFNAGDIVEIAGAGSFSVAEVAGNDIRLIGSNTALIAADAAITLVDASDFSLAFQPMACVAAFRKLENPNVANSGVEIADYTDPATGITMRLMKWYNPSTERTHIKMEVLYGVRWVRPDLAVRVLK
jgi:hypothetical protein